MQVLGIIFLCVVLYVICEVAWEEYKLHKLKRRHARDLENMRRIIQNARDQARRDARGEVGEEKEN